MANHHNNNRNQRQYHPLWNLVNGRTIFVLAIVIAVLCAGLFRDQSAHFWGNVLDVVATALYPFVGFIAVVVLVWVWWMARPGRNRRH